MSQKSSYIFDMDIQTLVFVVASWVESWSIIVNLVKFIESGRPLASSME